MPVFPFLHPLKVLWKRECSPPLPPLPLQLAEADGGGDPHVSSQANLPSSASNPSTTATTRMRMSGKRRRRRRRAAKAAAAAAKRRTRRRRAERVPSRPVAISQANGERPPPPCSGRLPRLRPSALPRLREGSRPVQRQQMPPLPPADRGGGSKSHPLRLRSIRART